MHYEYDDASWHPREIFQSSPYYAPHSWSRGFRESSLTPRYDLLLRSTPSTPKPNRLLFNMGTLTADVPRLAEHCPHKLPSSCRLTSIPLCCACYDRRPHSTSYSVYVDGLGLVQRGTRWQNYCWFCKSTISSNVHGSQQLTRLAFWENRVSAAGVPNYQTRIPEDPDQTEFVQRWFEFHQGYRTVKYEDGNERRIPLIGEPLKDVTPGHIPRTLDELRNGIDTSSAEQRLRTTVLRASRQSTETSQPVRSLADTLDDLLEQAIAEEEEESTRNASQEALIPGNVDTRLAQREHTTFQFTRGLERRERQRAMFRRVYGTPEEIQSEEYVSPITSMFNRAWERHRQFQELRRAQESGLRSMQRHGESIIPAVESFHLTESDEGPDAEGQRPAERRFEGIRRGAELVAARATYLLQMTRSQPMFAGLDGDDRPEPLTDDQMTFKLECKVCLTQKADVACTPCGHLSMCSWCADQVIPVRKGSTIPKDKGAQCPVCRNGVKRRIKIFTV